MWASIRSPPRNRLGRFWGFPGNRRRAGLAGPGAEPLPITSTAHLLEATDAAADDDLVGRYRAGDAAAFDAIVDRHWDWLVRRCLRHLGGDSHEAEDVAQDCLVKLQVVLAGEAPLRLRPWLSVVARNRCIDVSRRRRAVPVERTPDVALEDVHPTTNTHLVRAWRALNARHRSVLELRELGGLSYNEIAAAMAITPSAVETLLFRARAALRREYTRIGGAAAAFGPSDAVAGRVSGRPTILDRLVRALQRSLPSRLGGDGGGVLASGGGPSPVSPISDLAVRAATSPAVGAITAAGAGGGPGVGRASAVAAALAAVGLLVGGPGPAAPATPPPASVSVPSPPATPAAPTDVPAAPTAPTAPSTPPPPAADTSSPPAPPPSAPAPAAPTVAGLPVPVADGTATPIPDLSAITTATEAAAPTTTGAVVVLLQRAAGGP